jgi:hypothetical protein
MLKIFQNLRFRCRMPQTEGHLFFLLGGSVEKPSPLHQVFSTSFGSFKELIVRDKFNCLT